MYLGLPGSFSPCRLPSLLPYWIHIFVTRTHPPGQSGNGAMWQLSSRPSASVRPLVVKKPNRRQQGQTRSRILHTPSPSVAVAPSRRLREKCQRPFLRPAVVRLVRPPFPLRERARMKQPSRIARARPFRVSWTPARREPRADG